MCHPVSAVSSPYPDLWLICKPLCRSVNLVEFSRFIHKLGVLLHMDTRKLADTILKIAQGQIEARNPTLDDSAISFSMETMDPIAQVSLGWHRGQGS